MDSRKLRTGLIIAVFLFLAWRVLSLGMADHLARDKPEQALFWRSSHPEALFRMAEISVSRKQWADARLYGLKALKANQLDGRPLRVLAQVAEHEGDARRAADLFNKAVALAPRDVPSHVWLLEHALKQRQAQPAAKHLDALLRVAPELSTVLLPQAAALAVNPVAQDAMVRQLALNPPWRRHLLTTLAASTFSAEQIVPVYVKLKAQAELEPADYLPLIERLNKENRYTQAYVTWANLIPEKQRKYLGNVFDGGFELAIEEQIGAYGWLVQPVEGAQALLYSTSGTYGETSFYLEFDGRRTPYANLSQALALPAGPWQLSFRAKADRLESVRGLVWRIICQNDGRTLAETQPMRGRFNWQEFKQTVEIPEACTGQRLILMIPARIPAETQIAGTIWLDEVKIQAIE